MIDPRLAWFVAGAAFGAVLCGWPWHPRSSRYNRNPDSSKKRPRRFAELQPLRLDPGSVQRGNGRGAPATTKPPIKPQPTGGAVIIGGQRYPLASWSVPLRLGSNPPSPGRKPEPPCTPPPSKP